MRTQLLAAGVWVCAAAVFVSCARLSAGEPGAEFTAEKIQALVKDLGNDDFEKRQAAEKELVKAGAKALPALQAAMNSPDAQVKATATRLEARVRFASLGPVDYMDVVPVSLMVVAQAKNIGASVAGAKKTAIGQLLLSPQLAPFREKLEAALNAEPEAWKMAQLWMARFNGQVAWAMWEMNPQDPSKMRMAVMGEITDPDPQAVFDDFLKQTQLLGPGAPVEAYKGVNILQQAPGGPAVAMVDKHLLLGINADSLKVIVDGFLTRTGFGASPGYAKMKPSLGAKPEFILAVDFEKYMQEITKMMAAAVPPPAAGTAKQPDPAAAMKKLMASAGVTIKHYALSSACVGDGFEDRFVLTMEGEPKGLMVAGMIPPDALPPLNAMALVPANAVAATAGYLNGAPLRGALLEYLKSLKEMMASMPRPPGVPAPALPDFDAVLKMFEEKTGLKAEDLAASIKGEMGGYVVLAPGVTTQAPDIGLFLTCTDPEKAKAFGSAVAKALNAYFTPAPVKEVPLANRTLYQLDLAALKLPVPPNFPYGPCWAVEGNHVFLASSVQALRKQLTYIEAKTPGLLTQPDFVKALGTLTADERKGQVMYMDMKSALAAGATLGLPLLQGTIPDPQMKAALATLPPPSQLFKDMPPLLSTSVQRGDRAESIIRGPVPPMATIFFGAMGAAILMPRMAMRPPAPPDQPPGGF